jgi:hypothetical protein
MMIKYACTWVAFTAIGCKGATAPPAPAPPAPSTSQPAAGGTVAAANVDYCEPGEPECMLTSCGGNSATINSFPINGLRLDGECNPDGVQLLPGSMLGGVEDRCRGSTLTVRDNQLVGVRRNGTVACEGHDLAGASFVVRSWVKKPGSEERRTLAIRITDMKLHRADGATQERMAYRMISDGQSLCTASGSSKARQDLGLELITGLTDPSESEKLYVIPVWSELYYRGGIRVPTKGKWRAQSPEWLNLACVDDGLAKRSLYGLHTDNVSRSRAALNMLVARYCGERHITKRGVNIAWEQVPALKLEAKWGPEGAVCVSRPRLLHLDGDDAKIPSGLTDDPATVCSNCSTAKEWLDKLRACEYAYRPGHAPATAIPTCEDCSSPACNSPALQSYIVPRSAASP